MPKNHRPKPLYQRGNYRLDRRPDRKNLVITHYDPERKRERITSAGTDDLDVAKRNLDVLYIQNTPGTSVCPTCGQPMIGNGSALATDIISDYLVAHAANRESNEAIKHRLVHVIRYISTLAHVPKADQIDQDWIEGFRKWFAAQPIVSKTGKRRERSLSTIENSVLQLAAAINWGHSKGHTLKAAQFRPHATTKVNRTPQYRADIPTIAKMFAYAAKPELKSRRQNLLRFLRMSFATLGRPDAVHDVSTSKDRGQWNSQHRILDLNPKGRHQTKKYRATLPIIDKVADELDITDGFYIPINSVKSAFESMMRELGMPGDGESGMKLIRRSMADILRARLPQAHWGELEIFLGHERFKAVSGLYAPFRPDYLVHVKAELEVIAEEVEKLAPGAFYRTVTAQKPALRVVNGGKNG